MTGDLLEKYRWHLITVVTLYVEISLWPFFLTGSPQMVPFEYGIH